MSTQNISGLFKYCPDVQSGKIDKILPARNSILQLPTQPHSHHEISPQQSLRPVQSGQLISRYQSHSSYHGNVFPLYPPMYGAALPSYAIITDERRLQGMETTIQYLRELLSKEMTNNLKEKKTVEKLKKELEVAQEHNRRHQEQLQEALIKINETKEGKGEVNSALEDVLKAQKESSAYRRELQDAQSELISAQKIICDLKAANTILESEVTDSSKEECQLARLSSTGKITGMDTYASGGENDFASLKTQYEVLKYQLDDTIDKKNTVSNQFKELGKKYLYMVEYSGEQMYIMYGEKHAALIEKLKTLNVNPVDETQRVMIKQTLDCLQGQLELLEDCREDFRVTIELLMCRIDQEIAQVSDLSIRAPKPSLEIPLDSFDLLYQMIGEVGRNSEEGIEASPT